MSVAAAPHDFPAWFGDSKVVDANGRPLVVYRGEYGEAPDFSTLTSSITFSDSQAVASHYAMLPNNGNHVAKASRVLAAYLRIERPLVNTDSEFICLTDVAIKLGAEVESRVRELYYDAAMGDDLVRVFYLLDDEKFLQAARHAGYDGAIHGGTSISEDTKEYRVFSVDQIKPALSISQDINLTSSSGVDPWITGSRVINADGSPKTVFHGTVSAFDEFHLGSDGGIYCAAESSTAAFYARGEGARVISCELSLRRPLEMTEREWRRGVTDSGINHYLDGSEGLLAKGFDGLLIHPTDSSDPALSSTIYVVFGVNQIRSASLNSAAPARQESTTQVASKSARRPRP